MLYNHNTSTTMKKLIALLLLATISHAVLAQKKVKKIPDILSEKHWAYIPKKVDLTKSSISDTPAKIVETGDFFISKYEVTVHEYRRFLASLPSEEVKKHIPNQDGWKLISSQKERIFEFYHQHTGFDNYPIVNIKKEDADAFATWLSHEYNGQKKRKFKKVSFRLPTEAEWELAARGDQTNKVVHPWGSPYMQSKDGKYKANVLRVSGRMIKNSWDKDGNPKVEVLDSFLKNKSFVLTSRIATYPETQFGLFDMIGNVSEMTTSEHPEKKGALITKGGSYALSEYWAQIDSQYPLEGSNAFTGFRLIMEVIEK